LGAGLKVVARLPCLPIRISPAQLRGTGPQIVLDLREITRVDVEVVRFLETCKAAGVAIVNKPQSIREWMDREGKVHSQISENEREPT